MSAASPNIVVARVVTAADRAKRLLFPGRKKGVTPASWVTDLAELKKAIALCETCVKKFSPSAYGYRLEPNIPTVISECDGCRETVTTAWLFVHEDIALQRHVR